MNQKKFSILDTLGIEDALDLKTTAAFADRRNVIG